MVDFFLIEDLLLNSILNTFLGTIKKNFFRLSYAILFSINYFHLSVK